MRVLQPGLLPVIVSVWLVILAGPVGVAAQVATPDLANLPEAVAPLGLGSVDLPADDAGVEALFAALPRQVDGHLVNPVEGYIDRVRATWGAADSRFGPPLFLQALSFEDGDFFPADFTAGDYVAMAGATADHDATAFGRDGDIVWIRAETSVGVDGDKPGTPVDGRTLYTLAWGIVDSPWLYTAAADSSAGLEALVMAFVTASSGASG